MAPMRHMNVAVAVIAPTRCPVVILRMHNCGTAPVITVVMSMMVMSMMESVVHNYTRRIVVIRVAWVAVVAAADIESAVAEVERKAERGIRLACGRKETKGSEAQNGD